MRVTNRMLQQSVARHVQANLQRIAKVTEQVSGGTRLTRSSDDPAAVAAVMRDTSEQRGLAQYQRGISAARGRLNAEESVVDQLTSLVSRARELAVSEASSTASSATRQAANAEVAQLLDQVVQLGNTSVGGERIFGGAQTTAPPFQPGGAYVGDDAVRMAEVGPNQAAATSHTGRQLLLDSGVVAGLTALKNALQANDPTAIAASGAGLTTGFDKVQTLLSEVGSRIGYLDVTAANIESLDAGLTSRISDRRDVDIEAAVTELAGAQTTLQAALLSASRILQTSLAQYL